MTKKMAGFNLDIETIEIIEDFKWKVKASKSEIICRVFKYFGENPNELKRILNNEKE